MKRTFHPGDDWLYVKLYSGPDTAEEYLATKLPDIIKEWESRLLIDGAFFIRYADPLLHLRIRFSMKNQECFSDVLDVLKEFSSEFLQNGMIWKMEIGTYEREMERFGEDWIETAEHIFAIDSRFWLSILSDLREDEEGENKRWQVALLDIHQIFNHFDVLMDDRIILLTRMINTLYTELGGDKKLRWQINGKFRKYNLHLKRILNHPDEILIGSYMDMEAERSIRMQNIPGFINNVKSWDNEIREVRISDIIHLSINRGLRSKHRMHELVIYSFLKRLYISSIAGG